MRALELYLRYDRSAAAVINELSYPDRQTLRLRYRKLEVSKKTAFRYLTMGRPPYRGRLRRTPQATRSTVARNQPSPIPKPRQNTLPQASHRHPFTTAQTHASKIHPRNKHLLGKQSQTATTNQQAITSPRS